MAARTRTRATCRALMHVRVSTNGALALPRWGTGESLGGRLHPQLDPQPPLQATTARERERGRADRGQGRPW